MHLLLVRGVEGGVESLPSSKKNRTLSPEERK